MTTTLKPFANPVPGQTPAVIAVNGRGNDNVLSSALNVIFASIGLPPTQTAGVSSASSATILPAPTGAAFALVEGDDGTNGFIDLVAWHHSGTNIAIAGTNPIHGTPVARTYTNSAGILQLKMASGVYAVSVVPITF